MKRLMLLLVLGGAAFGGDRASREPALAAELHSLGWIVFSAQTPHGDWDLYLMRPDGSEPRAHTDPREAKEAGPRFSPDGKRFFYSRRARSESSPCLVELARVGE